MTTTDEKEAFRPGLREALPALLLVVGAVGFAVLVRHQQLSTWVGPGFSMFADVDYQGTRRVQIEVSTAQGTATAVLPEDMTESARRQRLHPSDEALTELADQLLERRWVIDEDGFYAVAGDGEGGATAELVVARLVTMHVDGDRIAVVPRLEVESAS